MFNPTVSFFTLGCKLNFSETSAIGRQLTEAGFSKVGFEEGADVVVINTCSVTENADRECRAVVRKALTHNPDSFIAVTGCYAQLKPEAISKMDGVDLVLGASEKFRLNEFIGDFRKRKVAEVHSCEIGNVNSFHSAFSLGDRTRTFLKVQDGCDYSCTYCTIPLARGFSRSDEIENVLKNVRDIADAGVKEVVLTGVNLGDFGTGTDGKRYTDFFSLIRRLEETNGIERFRISSIEPNLLKDEIISFVARSEKFVPHFHIPLQSGSDKILRLMKRRYNTKLYAERIARIRELMPHACIGADVITGFPGETDEDFIQTHEFIRTLSLSYLHVFTYSERDNTEAVSFKGVVPMSERKRRNKTLRVLSEKLFHSFCESQQDSIRKVLIESVDENGYAGGYTDNYIRVNTKGAEVNEIISVALGEVLPGGGMSGVRVHEPQAVAR